MEILSNATFSGNITTNGDLNVTSGKINLGGFSTWTCGFKSFSNSTFTFPDIGCGSVEILTTKHHLRGLDGGYRNISIFHAYSPEVPEGCLVFEMDFSDSANTTLSPLVNFGAPLIVQFNYQKSCSTRLEFPLIEYYFDKINENYRLIVSRASSKSMPKYQLNANILVGTTEFGYEAGWKI